MSGLSSLAAVVTHIPPSRDARGLIALSDSLVLWSEAELIGDPVSRLKRNAAVGSLRSSVIESVCGARWLTAESDVEHGRKSLPALTTMVTSTLPSRFQQSLSEVFRRAHSLNEEELALIALDIAKVARLVETTESETTVRFLASIRLFLRLLAVDNNSIGSVPALDEEGAQFALKNPFLMQFLRLLLLVAHQNHAAEAAQEANA